MRVVLDATPLLGQRTGVGTYVHHLVQGLSELDGVDLTLTAFSGRARRPTELPVGVAWRHCAVPARVLRGAWMRASVPRVEWLVGRHDVFHGTNFVLPPTRSAGVVTIHDLSYERFPELVSAASLQYRVLVPRGLRTAAAVVTPSATVRDEVIEQYRLPPERVFVTPLGVADAWLSAQRLDDDRRTELGVPHEYVAFIGTREPRKNLRKLLTAHRAYWQAGGRTSLVLVGAAGWADLRPGDGTVVLPHLPEADVRGIVAGARALAFPSLYEGFGLPVLEAMAAGTSVICSDIPVLREVAGVHAQFVDPQDADAWSHALETARPPADPGPARDWAATFTWARCAESTAATYAKAVGSQRASATV